jgi:putative tricarboxylic transport membrane protein
MFACAGAFFALIGSSYPFGEIRRMGPGFLPVTLGILLIAIGLVVLVGGLASRRRDAVSFRIAPAAKIIFSVIFFALALKPLGYLCASAGLVVLAGSAGEQVRWRELIVAAIVMAVATAFLFIWLLSLPLPVFPRAISAG